MYLSNRRIQFIGLSADPRRDGALLVFHAGSFGRSFTISAQTRHKPGRVVLTDKAAGNPAVLPTV